MLKKLKVKYNIPQSNWGLLPSQDKRETKCKAAHWLPKVFGAF